jgi:hypothetical protein
MLQPRLPVIRFILRLHVLVLLFYFSDHADAQYYNLGQDPASLKWRHIQTDHFRIIYPVDFEKHAQRLTNLFEFTYRYGTKTLDCKPSRVPVILHNRDIIPNAFSLWAPRRIELFTCPPQNTYSQNWLEQLALHEYRHIVQMDMMNKGFTKGMTWLAGEQATAALTGLLIPMWFMEGDAVCAETALSHSGRGRMPSFEMELRAQVMEKGIYNYDKAVLGSYKDFIPDHYMLGYPLVASTRARYGYDAWIKAMDVVARQPFIIAPLNKGLKKTTGFNKSGLYYSILKELDSLWKIQALKETHSKATILSKNLPGQYKKYKYPHYLNDSLIIAERTSPDDISRFVILNRKGIEHVVCTPGFFSSEIFSIFVGTGASAISGNKPGIFTIDNLSISKGLLAWTEREADPRWQNRNYSVIRLYDLGNGKTRQLTSKSRYFSPAISPDGRSILAVKVTEDNESSMVLINIESGREESLLLSSKDGLFISPSWSQDGTGIVYITLDEHGKSLNELNVMTGKSKVLIDASFSEISYPSYAGEYILFNGSWSGIENIYALRSTDRKIFRVTASVFGACNADFNPNTNRIIYSDYFSDGYRIAEADFDPGSWMPLEKITDQSVSLYRKIISDEDAVMDSTTVSDSIYLSRPYRKAAHLFKFHSWAPLYVNYSDAETKTGISFMSQNDLSTATTILGYEWDYAGRTGLYRFSFDWTGWYPIFDVDITTGNRAVYYSPDASRKQRYSWSNNKISGGVKLPLLFNQGQYYSVVQLMAHTSLLNIRHHSASDTLSIYMDGNFSTFDFRLTAYRFRKQAIKDVYPRWGQVIDLNFRISPKGANTLGNIWSGYTILYFPGLFKHHGLRVYSGMQFRNAGSFAYEDQISAPRGYFTVNSEQFFSFLTSYKLPLLYPDLKIGPLAYIKRLKAGIFYDHAIQHSDGSYRDYNSIGAEITSDLHLMRFILPFDMGVRTGYRITDRKWFADFLFAINLSI